jgi:hypothetical protein
VCSYNRFHGNVVNIHWALWDIIYACVFITLLFPVIVYGQLAVNMLMVRESNKQSRYTPWRRFGGEEV